MALPAPGFFALTRERAHWKYAPAKVSQQRGPPQTEAPCLAPAA